MFPCLGFLLLSSQLVSVSHSTIKSPRPVTFHVLNTAPCAWKVLEGEGLFLKGSCSLSAPGPRQKPELQMHHGRPSLPEDILGDPASPRTSWCGQEDKCCTPNPGLLELCLGQMRGINGSHSPDLHRTCTGPSAPMQSGGQTAPHGMSWTLPRPRYLGSHLAPACCHRVTPPPPRLLPPTPPSPSAPNCIPSLQTMPFPLVVKGQTLHHGCHTNLWQFLDVMDVRVSLV
ncbi:uncharacterized protein LOC114808898 isoform X1 [Ornithorhynchus anatinus]|uniref:uncharacterized protein LOC114808898 isoform X1 n=1 Tax=Ornithorhynchus anatinus TaxID=9258 RepID=UPI0010A8EA76|nr:uncharacterized protein LOC114808898 isoform X1 [Ornithorhynchus anatinus]